MITFKVETEREDDGRWLAEVLELPGVLAYGESEDAALSRVQALALRVVAERLEHGEAGPELLTISFNAEGKDEETIQAFKDYLLDRVFVVMVATQSMKSAYRLFNVLNARGMPLSNADFVDHFMEVSLRGGPTELTATPGWRALGSKLKTKS